MTSHASDTPDAANGVAQLKHDSGSVLVTPENEDRFMMPSKTAVLACQFADMGSRLMEVFQSEFIDRLDKWCKQHDSQVSECYIPCEKYGKCIKVFVISRSATFDFQLSDEISDLESELIQSGWHCDILQIASVLGDERQAFFDTSTSMKVYGDGQRTTAPSES